MGQGDSTKTLGAATNRIVGRWQQHKRPFIIGDKMSVVQRKAMLKSEGFFPHKKNVKGTTIIYSRKHPTAKSVRVVIDSGIDNRTNKVVAKLGIKLCFVNRSKSWREVTTQIFTTNTGLIKTIKAQEAAEKFVKTCKHCKAKKFTAKTGNVVCSNACWTAWGGKKKAASPKKKTSQKTVASSIPKGPIEPQKKKAAKKPQRKAARKSSQKIVAEILPGDLVTVEEITLREITTDYTGSILGVVMKVDQHGRVDVNWTADTSGLPEWDLPHLDHYIGDSRRTYRFKVLSRKAEWVKAS
jgi:hypothetical protein